MTTFRITTTLATFAMLSTACGGEGKRSWQCNAETSADTEFLPTIGCMNDFSILASEPLDSSIPGARSGKVIIDRLDENRVYFQNSNLYPTHYEFATSHLSGNGLPIVPMLADFNNTEYTSTSRRLVLGAITYYEGPDLFAYELAPYDTADAKLIAEAYQNVAEHVYFGQNLYFHPTSNTVERQAASLPDSVKTISTDELFAGIDFQALNTGVSYGQLRFVGATEVDSGALSFRDIAVLDLVPNDISVVMGIITGAFQTPLSHVNVLSQNRGTPNMALRDAFGNMELRALEGKWVRLTVGPFDYEVVEVSKAEADSWWEENKPAQVLVPGMDLSVSDLRNIENVLPSNDLTLLQGIKTATRAFGGKAAHYGALSQIEAVSSPKAFAIPVFYYRQFMEANGFDQRVVAMLEDPEFQNDPLVRKTQLAALRNDIEATPLDPAFESLVLEKLAADYPGIRMRFRSSTNAEDLDGFTGAGLYTSKSGDPNDVNSPPSVAIRKVWASIWNYRAFEERTYRSIDHSAVGMALLVHRSFPDEEANGVALTNNPFEPSGLDPAFYINVQRGEASVVQPAPGVTTDQIVYYYDRPNQPAVFIGHSSLVAQDSTVLSDAQLFELGQALSAIRSHFASAYGGTEWWAMDVEFKFDGEPGQTPALFIKQARPFGP